MFVRPIIVALLAAVASISSSFAEDYPSKPVKLVVGQPAGGSSDALARLVGRQLEGRLKQTFVIENRPGASGNIAALQVAKSAADGYTLLLTAGPFSINPSLYSKLPFDTIRDFVPVAQISSSASVLVVNKDHPVNTIEEFMAMAKDAGRPVAYASSGNGTAQHLAMELLRVKAGLELFHIPYKGGAPAMIDLLGGQVKFLMGNMADVSKHVTAGNMKAIAQTGATRFELLPDVPTLIEKGLADTVPVAGLEFMSGRNTARNRQAPERRDQRRPGRGGRQGQDGRAGIRGQANHPSGVRRLRR
jgi:tripartite-type tricarboxylate transporter receptor subunit TctC